MTLNAVARQIRPHAMLERGVRLAERRESREHWSIHLGRIIEKISHAQEVQLVNGGVIGMNGFVQLMRIYPENRPARFRVADLTLLPAREVPLLKTWLATLVNVQILNDPFRRDQFCVGAGGVPAIG